MSDVQYGQKITDISQIYKGDGVTSCKWCGGTGYMHTYSNAGYFYNDAPCVCELGQKILNERMEKEDECDP